MARSKSMLSNKYVKYGVYGLIGYLAYNWYTGKPITIPIVGNLFSRPASSVSSFPYYP